MLLEVERPRLEVEFEAEQIPYPVRKDQVPAEADGVGDQLDDVRRDGDARVAQREEHVDGRADGAEEHADDPGADRVGGQVDVVVADDGADLEVVLAVFGLRIDFGFANVVSPYIFLLLGAGVSFLPSRLLPSCDRVERQDRVA